MCLHSDQRQAVLFCWVWGVECRATWCCAFAAGKSLRRQIGTASSLVVLWSVQRATTALPQTTVHRTSLISVAEATPQLTAFEPQRAEVRPLRRRCWGLGTAILSFGNQVCNGIVDIGWLLSGVALIARGPQTLARGRHPQRDQQRGYQRVLPSWREAHRDQRCLCV